MEVWPQALKELGALVADGKLKYREIGRAGHRARARGLPRPAEGQELRQAAGQAGLMPTGTGPGARFDGSGRATALYDALALRCQRVHPRAGAVPRPRRRSIAHAWHLLGRDDARRAAGLPARGRSRASKYDEPSIGRVVIDARAARAAASAAQLVREGLARCARHWPGRGDPHQRAGAPAALLRPARLRDRSATNTSKTAFRTSTC